ncbi:MAG TPA: DUF1615 domain-containing protein, partial [Burkholderiaceae bacterium]|nr:DUF1615 domain-containing protein [Burkholderiaceae bacterium]
SGLNAADARTLIVRLLPPNLPDRSGWAADIYAAFATQDIAATKENICAVLAVTEQESTFRSDPPVPGLASIAWQEIDRQADRAGVPRFAVHAALRLTSSNGKSYSERIDAATTEKQLSEIFEDFISMVPLGKTFLASRNPVRTGGPMQVSIAFAEDQAAAARYPYPVEHSIRHEVFTRRGGMYFGIAHLLGYEAPYSQPLYRFADFNAGRYASRNAAFQNALSIASGVPLVLDGDLLPPGAKPETPTGSTELAALAFAKRLDMTAAAIRRDLERGTEAGFERTRLYERVFARADQANGRPVPRAVLPAIDLKSPKIKRKLTTEWFARRVDERYQRCTSRVSQQSG